MSGNAVCFKYFLLFWQEDGIFNFIIHYRFIHFTQ